LSIEYSSLYESQAIRELRGKHKIVNIGWWLLIQIIKLLSFGKIDAEPTEFMIVLKKKKGSYDCINSTRPECGDIVTVGPTRFPYKST
jgi:hypothetical protein